MFRFTIRELVILTVTAGLAVGWWMEHRQLVPLRKRCDRLVKLSEATVAVLRRLGHEAHFHNDNISIGSSSSPPERAPWNQGPDATVAFDLPEWLSPDVPIRYPSGLRPVPGNWDNQIPPQLPKQVEPEPLIPWRSSP